LVVPKAMTITFRALTDQDLPLLHSYLTRPHVAEWWDGIPTLEEVREDYGSRLTDALVLPLDAGAGVVQYLACVDGEPFGFIQAYRVIAHQHEGWWLDERDPHALGIDQFIGDEQLLNRGLGTEMVRTFVDGLFSDARVTKVQTDPDPDNARAIRCYRKAGFHDLGVVQTPDGPALWMVRERDSL
jgi:RimJ/RimL family protein N-acetyltransferase